MIKRVKRRSKGLIASNAYDLTLLVDMLTEVAKQYPNEFPWQRKPMDEKVKASLGKQK